MPAGRPLAPLPAGIRGPRDGSEGKRGQLVYPAGSVLQNSCFQTSARKLHFHTLHPYAYPIPFPSRGPLAVPRESVRGTRLPLGPTGNQRGALF